MAGTLGGQTSQTTLSTEEEERKTHGVSSGGLMLTHLEYCLEKTFNWEML